MKGIKIIALCAASVVLLPLQAQTTPPPLTFGGSVLNHDMMWAPDFAQMSQTHVFGTARVMGMGGAFTSLGADISSMSLNPAGLGMYRRNEISLTPMVTMSGANTPGTQSWVGNSKTRFAFANVGAALNLMQNASGGLTSLTLGIGMNRIADFNTRYSYSSESLYSPGGGPMPSIVDIFSQQMNRYGVRPDDVRPGADPYGGITVGDWSPNTWPAILGYWGFMVDNVGTADKPEWVPARVGQNASVLHSMDVLNQGSINEFAISMGANINNIVYLGATLGIQSVHKKMGVTYQEEYGYFNSGGIAQNGDGLNLTEQLDMMNLYQQTVIDGSGVNFKLGVVVRPVGGLRIGMAYHTPTFYSLDRTYKADIFSDIRDNASKEVVRKDHFSPTSVQEGDNSWDFVSPSKLMFGASYTFGNFAILSIDYQRDWYNGIRVKNIPANAAFTTENRSYTYSIPALKSEFKEQYQATNSIRAGLEIRPLPILALRVGGGYTGSMLKDKNFYTNDAYASMPTTYESYYFSAGVGINLSRNTVLDLAYQNVTNKQSEYQLFFSYPEGGGNFETWSGVYETNLKRHYLSLTLGFRF